MKKLRALFEAGWDWLMATPFRQILALAVVMAVLMDFNNTCKFGGVDLRNRVVGARLLLAGKDPYTYKWKPGEPERFLDKCDNFSMPVNRVTASPAALLLYAPLAWLDYSYIRVAWFFIQWACFFTLAAMLAACARAGAARNAMLLVLAVVFAMGDSWRMHVERGQVYVLFALLLAAAYWVGRKENDRASLACGLILGVTAALRPPLILVAAPFLLTWRWRTLLGIAVGVLLAAGLPVLFGGWNCWHNFFHAADLWGRYSLGQLDWLSGTASFPLPTEVEGVYNLSLYFKQFLETNSSLGKVLRLPNVECLEVVFVFLLVAYGWLLGHVWRPGRKLTTFLIAGITCGMLAEFFVPAPRYSYSNITWAVPVCLLLIQEGSWVLLKSKLAPLLILGLIFANGVASLARWNYLILGDFTLLSYFLIVSVLLARGRWGSAASIISPAGTI
jgi:hypothetical protein